MKMTLRLSRLIAALFTAISMHAATITWTNTAGGNWNVAANWSPNQVPGSSDSAFITNNGTYTVTNSSLTVSNVTLGGGSGQQILDWNASTLASGSVLTVASNATLLVGGSFYSDFYGVVTNAGTVTMTAAYPLQMGAAVDNLAGAVFNVQGDYGINSILGGGVFNNAGLVNITVTGNPISINVPFNNNGTLNVQTGVVNVEGGGSSSGLFSVASGATLIFNSGCTLASGGQINGAGNVQITGNFLLEGTLNAALSLSGGTFTNDGTLGDLSISNLTVSSETLSGSSNWMVNGTWNWNASTLASGSVLTVASNATLLVGGSFYSDFYGVVTNAGTVTMTAAYPLQMGAAVDNLAGAVFNVQGDYGINSILGGGVFNNAGLVNITVTGSPISINVPFNNNGTLNVQSGTLNLTESYSLTNGTLNFGISSATNFGIINLSGSPAALAGMVSANLNNGYVPSADSSFPVIAYSSESGVFTNFNLPFAVAWQTNYGSMNFTLNVLNVRPALAVITNQTVNELTTLTVTNTATDSNLNATLSYSLLNAPGNMIINASGIITWTPAQTQSPSTNTVVVSVTDNGTPPLSATNSFTVIVNEVNVAPALPVIAQTNVNELTLLTVTNTATDSNIHSMVGYALVSPLTGMSISTSGIITWTPSQAQSPGTNTITTVATSTNNFDLVNPQLSATNSFTVIVNEINLAQGLTNIIVSPPNPIIGAGTNQQFAATGYYSDGSSKILTDEVTGGGGWTAVAGLPMATVGAACATVNNQFYVVAGSSGNINVFSYNPVSNVWTTNASFPFVDSNASYAYAGAVGIGTKIYVMGGCGDGNCIYTGNELEIYDTTTNGWSAGAPMPTPTTQMGVGVINGKIYVAGGAASGLVIAQSGFQIYDPASNTWTSGQSMPVAVDSYGVAVINDKLYVVGGYDNNGTTLGSLLVYDPTTDRWTTNAPLPTPRGSLGAAAVNGLLYAIDGQTTSGMPTNLVEVYNPATNGWSTGAPTLIAHSLIQPVVINGTIYVAGGGPGDTSVTNAESYTPQSSLWSSSSPTVASINTNGLTMGLTNGVTTITATSGSVSGNATLTVVSSPAISTQPADKIVSFNSSVTLSVSATGGVLSYQWQFDGTNINSATGASLTITNVSVANTGVYTVIVNNAAGSVTSTSVTLAIASVGIKLLGGVADVIVSGPLDSNYVIQATSNLLGSWTTLTNVSLPTQPYIYIDYSSPTNPRQFYRAVPQ